MHLAGPTIEHHVGSNFPLQFFGVVVVRVVIVRDVAVAVKLVRVLDVDTVDVVVVVEQSLC